MEPGSSQRCRRNRMRANRHKLENEKFQSDIRKTFLPRSVETLQQMSTLATIPPSLEVSKIQLDIEFSNLISLDLLWGGLGISRGLPNFIILWLLDSVLSRTRFFFLHDSLWGELMASLKSNNKILTDFMILWVLHGLEGSLKSNNTFCVGRTSEKSFWFFSESLFHN